MRRLTAVASLAFVAVLATAGTASARALETIKVSNTSTSPVKSTTVLDPEHRYRITVKGTVSDWCTTTACPPGDATKVAQPNIGVDGVWCYAKWRCPTPEAWQQLSIDGKGILDFAGLTPDEVPYSGGHVYSVVVTDVSGALSLGAGDALAGSTGDNSGAFSVTIVDLGLSPGATPSAAVKKLQSALRSLGFYSGPLDGKSNVKLIAAVKSFQHAVGMRPDGKCEVECQKAIQKALGLDDPALPPGAPPVTHSTVLKLQQDLRSLGFFTGALDGKNGPGLVEAVKQFQHTYGLKPDGKCAERCQLELVQQLSK